jgi:hypothetical protein
MSFQNHESALENASRPRDFEKFIDSILEANDQGKDLIERVVQIRPLSDVRPVTQEKIALRKFAVFEALMAKRRGL